MSVFKDLKQGNSVYLLDRNTMKVQKGNVVDITPPHVESNPNMTFKQVVDVTVNVEGKTTVYVVPEGASVTYHNNLIISCDRECVLNEVKSVKVQVQQTLESVDELKAKLAQCDITIAELDEVYREKQENDARLTKLENMVQTLLDKLS